MTVLVTGPESSGKSTLARALAWCLDGIYVAEIAREYLHARGGVYTEEDLPQICARQVAVQATAVQSGASLVVCDTGPEVINVWSEVKYGRVDPSVEEAVHASQYQLVFLCCPDLPWQPDPLRESPQLASRQAIFDRYRKLLPTAHRISGEGRIEQALSIVASRSASLRNQTAGVPTNRRI